MRHFSDRPQETRASASRRQKTPGRLSFESLEVRSMLSADAVTSDLVEFSKAAAGSLGGGYTPAEIRTAYGFNNVSFGSTTANGAGQTIAIVDAYNDPNIASDLATFDAEFGIAAPPSLKVVNQSGGTNLPGTRFHRRLGSGRITRRGMGPRHRPRGQHRVGRSQQRFGLQSVCGGQLRPGAGRRLGHFDELGQRRQRRRRLE